MSNLSQYEIEREANIARNRLLLEQLELKQAVEGIAPPKPKAKSAAAKPIQPAKREKRKRELEEVQPRRSSARLRKSVVDPNETPAKRRKREKEEEEERLREEQEKLEREEAARQAQRPRHNKLDLISLVEHGPEEIASLSKSMEAIPKESTQRIGDFDDFAFEDSKEDERALADLKERMGKLVVHARAKVTKSRVYCAAYHPEVTKDLIFFGDKEGAIGIWDARAPPDENEDDDGEAANEDREGGKYWRIQLHWPANAKSSVSSIKIDPIDSHNIYTTSYDTTVRSLSFTTGESRELFSSDNLVCCLDVAPSGNDIWLSDSLGWATHLDPRESKSKARSYGLSDNKIGTISINPTRPNFICTASNSRFVKVWDVRKLGDIVAELGDDSSATTIDFHAETLTEYMESEKGRGSMRAEYQHNKSATAAFWDPRGRQILSTSYDDRLRLWNLDAASLESGTPFKSFQPFSQVKHNCQTGKWVTLLKAQWSRNPDVYPHFTIGNMNHSLDIYTCKGDLVTRLADSRRYVMLAF
ncbi:hypothetical protein H1R20_g1717, partial [Candolleomyces eurysporus]